MAEKETHEMIFQTQIIPLGKSKLNHVIHCKCGCGKIRLRYDKYNQKREYVYGHNMGGKHLSEEHKQKLRIIRTGIPRTEETRRKLSISNTGKRLSEEVKKKLSIINTGKKMSDEAKKKMSIAYYNKKLNKDTFRNTKPERFLMSILSVNDIKYESQKKLYGRPDIFIEPNICIFVDGCFYHGCKRCMTEERLQYKIPQNALKRDPIVNQTLEYRGYIVLRFWEHKIINNLNGCLEVIKQRRVKRN